MIDPKTLLAFRQIDILKDLSPESQNILASFSTVRSIRKGETLFCQGEPSPYCFGVLSGEVTLAYAAPDAKPSAQIYAAGCLLGGLSLIQDMPRRGLASVSRDGELLSVWSSRFRSCDMAAQEKSVVVNDIRRVLKSYPNP